MGVVKGTDGMVKKDGVEIAGIDTWELTPAADKDETTDYTDGKDKTFIQTTVGWTGRISGSYNSTTTQMQALIDMFSSTSSLSSTVLIMYGSTSPKDLYKGTFLVDSIALTGSVGTKRSFDASVTATGGVARST